MLNRIKKILLRSLYKRKNKLGQSSVSKNAYVSVVSEKMEVPYSEALKIMKQIKNEYGISFNDFNKNKLYRFTGEELNEKSKALSEANYKKDYYAIKMIAKTTGKTIEETIAETNRIKETFNISIRTYWQKQLYEKTDDEILEYKKNLRDEKTKCVETVAELSGWSKQQVKDHMEHCKGAFHIKKTEYYMNYRCWEHSDEELSKFAVDEDSRLLSNAYNRVPSYLSNKLKFNKLFKMYLGRKYWKNTNASFTSFVNFVDGLDKVFCKPVNLSSGTGTRIIEIPKDKDELEKLYNDLMQENETLVEEMIIQHEDMNKVYSGSVNTIRLTMLKADNKCHRLWSFARFGSNGIVDNFHGGGMAAAVDIDTGILITDAMNSKGEFFESHPVTGVKFKGFQIPHWDKVLEITEAAMLSQDKVAYVGWDIAICPDKVVLVEGNSTPQVGVYQSLLAPVGQRPKYEEFLR